MKNIYMNEENNMTQILAKIKENLNILPDAPERIIVGVKKKLNMLPEFHRQVLELRYGLLDGIAKTSEETGRGLGMTQKNVIKVEKEALRMMR